MGSPRTKILFLIPSLSGGGAERVIVYLVNHIDKTKFDPVLAVVDTRSAAYLNDIPSDIEFNDLQCSRVRYAIFKVVKLIWEKKPSVVFSTLGHLNLLLAILKPLLPKNTRYLCRETTVVSTHLDERNSRFFWTLAYKFSYKRFDKIICQSIAMRDDLHINFGIILDKFEIINNPVDSHRIRRLAAEPIDTQALKTNANGLRANTVVNLVSAGRLAREKGFDLLIKALALNANPAIHLTILGEGELKEELCSLAKSLEVDKQIHFVGFKKNPYAYIARADAFVLSSRYEGFPNVVLESLACGTPVIATPAIGGTKEILDNMEGCLVADSVSAEGLARALSKFTFGKRMPPDVVGKYAVDRIVQLYEKQFI